MNERAADDEALNALTARFFAAFDNRAGAPDLSDLAELFLPHARIVRCAEGAVEIMTLEEFAAPRRRILSDGTLRDFVEREVSQVTHRRGPIAHRLCTYRKSWTDAHGSHEGGGVKSLQFVKTSDGWKIAAVAWADS